MHRGERREDGAEVMTGLDKCGPDLFGFTGLDNFFGSALVQQPHICRGGSYYQPPLLFYL